MTKLSELHSDFTYLDWRTTSHGRWGVSFHHFIPTQHQIVVVVGFGPNAQLTCRLSDGKITKLLFVERKAKPDEHMEVILDEWYDICARRVTSPFSYLADQLFLLNEQKRDTA